MQTSIATGILFCIFYFLFILRIVFLQIENYFSKLFLQKKSAQHAEKIFTKPFFNYMENFFCTTKERLDTIWQFLF